SPWRGDWTGAILRSAPSSPPCARWPTARRPARCSSTRAWTRRPMPDLPPRLNHVALSLPSAALQPDGRSEIVDFYGDVFGWTEYPQLTEDGRRLVLGLATYDQFV